MGLNPKSVRAADGDYKLEIGGILLGCLMDSVDVNDTRDVTTHETFCDAADDVKGKIAGGRDVSLSCSLELVIGSPGLAAAKAAYKANTEVTIKETMTSVDGLATEAVSYRGFITDFGKRAQLKNVIQRRFKLDVFEVVDS